jgi:hypothetical protein
MADIQKLAEKRARLLTEASDLVAATADKGETLTGEAQARFEALTGEATTIASAIRSEKDAVEARKAADAVRSEYATAIAPKSETEADEAAELRRLGREHRQYLARELSAAFAALAFRRRPPILGIEQGYEADGAFVIRLRALPIDIPEDRDIAIPAVTAASQRFYEEAIRRRPYAWWWLHDRWKRPA